MCGIFGGISPTPIPKKNINLLASFAQHRGKDSSGMVWFDGNQYVVKKRDLKIRKTIKEVKLDSIKVFAGHSRLITNGFMDNQPVLRNGIIAIHNGIILNSDDIWKNISSKPFLKIDSEVLPALASYFLLTGVKLDKIPELILENCTGSISAVLIFPNLGKLLLFSNTGSLYLGWKDGAKYFSSERFPLTKLGCEGINQITSGIIETIPASDLNLMVDTKSENRRNLIPSFEWDHNETKLLDYPQIEVRRCTKCILPETMPFIKFDSSGVCNYCNNYTPRNQPRSHDSLNEILEPYRQIGDRDVIIPFSGGRDSSYALHLAVEQFGLKPIAFTYDWGMITDLGRRNVSRMCSALGVENITIAADIYWKRKNIRKNFEAWLKRPNLGLLNIITAGDKHFYRHIETVKKQTQIELNLWGINPLETTFFKSGFLGIKPNFSNKNVFETGIPKQIIYQSKRFKEMARSPKYFNLSLFDTLSGEWYRSRSKKKGYFQLFDFWRWDETEINQTLDYYSWESADDSKSTWRIGDGSAAMYNYIFHRVAGLSEHDTFRSNQVREGDLSREKAMELTNTENLPRYRNIKWYLDTINLDFKEVITRINSIPRLHKN